MTFITAELKGAAIPGTVEKPVAAGADFSAGALLVEDANGAWAECAANPTAVAAISEHGFGADTTGFTPLGRTEFPPGFALGTPVQDGQKFHAQYLGALPAAPGASYGVTRDTDGTWKVDFGKNAGVAGSVLVVKLVSLEWTEAPINRNRVTVVVLDSVVQRV